MARRRTLPTLPALGPGYRKLWTATALSTAVDGIYYTALPLLAAGLTRDPLAVAPV